MQEINDNPVQEVVMDSLGQAHPPKEQSGFTALFDSVSYRLVLFLLFIAPLAVSFSQGMPFEAGKRFPIFLVGILALAGWFIARIKDHRLSFPGGLIAWTGLGVVLATAASTVGSGAFRTSFYGAGYETGTFVSTLFFFAIAFLSAVLIQNKYRISSFLVVFYVSVVAVFGIELAHLLAPSYVLPRILSDATANVVGKWNDLGIFFGLGVIISLLSLETNRFRGMLKTLALVSFVASLIGLSIVNFTQGWLIVGLVSIGVLVYFGLMASPGARRVSIAGVIALVLSAGFYFWGSPDQFVGRGMMSLAGVVGIQVPVDLEVRPSWSGTLEVAQNVLREDPILGTGPNRFVNAWFGYRPAEINQLSLWNVDFNLGVGFIPTMLATGGILGLSAWVLFLLALAWYGVRALMSKGVDPYDYTLILLSFSATAYLWLFQVIYIPSIAVTTLSFLFAGLFAGSLVSAGLLRESDWSIVRTGRSSFVSTLLLILCVLGTAWSGYGLVEKYSALKHFNAGIAAATAGDVTTAEKELKTAVELDAQDVYARALSEVYLARLNQIIQDNSANAETRRAQFQVMSEGAIVSARKAVEADPSRYVNWVALGNVYQVLVAPGIGGAYELSKESYEKALSLFPQSPSVHLNFARLEISKGDRKNARAQIAEALKKKSNFTPALFLLSQLEADEGNIGAAIEATEQAASLSPQDVGVHFQLGLLYYLKKDYKKTAEAMERAVAIVPSYANARYFLGLSYAFSNRRADAINQFKEIQKTNPNSTDVRRIISNLSEGRPVLDGLVAPERGANPPFQE